MRSRARRAPAVEAPKFNQPPAGLIGTDESLISVQLVQIPNLSNAERSRGNDENWHLDERCLLFRTFQPHSKVSEPWPLPNVVSNCVGYLINAFECRPSTCETPTQSRVGPHQELPANLYLTRWIRPHWRHYDWLRSEPYGSSPGFARCHWRRAVAPKSEI